MAIAYIVKGCRRQVSLMCKDVQAKIGMVTHGRFPGDTRIEKEASSLLNAGYQVYVYANRKVTQIKTKFFNGARIRYFSLRYDPVFLLIKLPKLLKEWFHADGICIAHAQDTPLVLPTILAAKSVNIPVIYDAHEVWSKLVSEGHLTPFNTLLLLWSKISETLGCRYAKAIFVTTHEIALYLADVYRAPLTKIHVIQNFCEIFDKCTLPKVRLPKDLFKVSYVGNLNTGELLLELFIESATYLKNRMKFRFYLVGDGVLRHSLELLAKKLNVEEYLEFTGWIPRKYALSYIAESDVCLLPYKQRFNANFSSPVKMFEYLSLGKPVISTALASCKRLLADAVYYWEPPTAERLAEIIYDLSQNKNLRKRLGKKGRELVKQKYNWSIEEKKIIQVYKSIESDRCYSYHSN